MREEIKLFYSKSKFHNDDRFTSFENCHYFFKELKRNSLYNKNKELAQLHLGFFLASWGMYRGSSFILQKNYKIYNNIIKILLKNKFDDLWDLEEKLTEKTIEKLTVKIYELNEELSLELDKIRDEWIEYTKDNCLAYKQQISSNKISKILITKIMLGTIGCIPAYDDFFKKGIVYHNKFKKTSLKKTFGKSAIRDICLFYLKNKTQLEKVRNELDLKRDYPLMKLIDAYFWTKGFLKESK